MSYPIFPVDKLTSYHLPSLLAAEAGRLHYDRRRYPIHGVSNNAMTCFWGGLLEDGNTGMRLTGEGRARLAEWRGSPEGRRRPAAERGEAGQDQQGRAVDFRRRAAPEPRVSVTGSSGHAGTVRSGSARRSSAGPVDGSRTSAASEKRPSGARLNGRPPIRGVVPKQSVPPGPLDPVHDTQDSAEGVSQLTLFPGEPVP